MCVCMHVGNVGMYVRMYVYIYICICMYICHRSLYVYIYMYMHAKSYTPQTLLCQQNLNLELSLAIIL